MFLCASVNQMPERADFGQARFFNVRFSDIYYNELPTVHDQNLKVQKWDIQVSSF